MSQILEDEKLEAKGQITNSWYNSAKTWEKDENGILVRPETVYVSKNRAGRWNPENAAFNMRLFRENMVAIKSGRSNDWGKVNQDPWMGDFKKLNDKRAQAIKSGGVGTSADFSAIDVVNVQAEMVNTELRDFVLEQAVTTVATPQILLSIDTYTRFTGQKAIAEGQPPVLKLGSVARATYTVPKDGTAVGLTFEAQTKSVHDLYRTHVDNAISDLRRIKSGSIATEMETATDVSAGDWAGITSDHYTRSVFDDIGTVTDTIVANNGRADSMAVHDRVMRDIINNVGAALFQGTRIAGEFSTARIVQLPGTNITIYVDNSKTATLATVYAKLAIIKMQGPVRTAVVRDDLADIDIFRIFDFNLPKLIIAGRARDLTSVSA
jgi:hypothetical protein